MTDDRQPNGAARETSAETAGPLRLPAPGYPISEHAVAGWFQREHGREPTDRELGAIIDAMAQREATSPRTGPNPEPQGWSVGPLAAPRG